MRFALTPTVRTRKAAAAVKWEEAGPCSSTLAPPALIGTPPPTKAIVGFALLGGTLAPSFVSKEAFSLTQGLFAVWVWLKEKQGLREASLLLQTVKHPLHSFGPFTAENDTQRDGGGARRGAAARCPGPRRFSASQHSRFPAYSVAVFP